jgi:hypothetical protein
VRRYVVGVILVLFWDIFWVKEDGYSCAIPTILGMLYASYYPIGTLKLTST